MPGLSKLGSLYVKAESTFSTDPDTDGSSYLQIPAIDPKWDPSWAPIEREVVRSTLGKTISSTPGQKGGKLTFKVPMAGLYTAAASGVTGAMPDWLTPIFEACGTVTVAGVGTTVSGGSSTTTSVDCADASGIAAGTHVMISGAIRLVTAKSGNTITVTPALPSAPSNATVVYSGVSAVLDVNDASHEPTTVAFVWKADGDEETILGCAGTWKIENFDAGARAMLSFEFQANTWSDTTNKSSLPTTFPTLTTEILAQRSSGATTGSALYWGATATAVASASAAFDPGLTLAPKPNVGGIEGRAGWVVTGEAAKLSVKPYSAQTTYRADFGPTPTLRTALLQVGNAAAAAFGVAMQQAQIEALPKEGDIGGIRANELVLRARAPSVSGLDHGFSLTIF